MKKGEAPRTYSRLILEMRGKGEHLEVRSDAKKRKVSSTSPKKSENDIMNLIEEDFARCCTAYLPLTRITFHESEVKRIL